MLGEDVIDSQGILAGSLPQVFVERAESNDDRLVHPCGQKVNEVFYQIDQTHQQLKGQSF